MNTVVVMNEDISKQYNQIGNAYIAGQDRFFTDLQDETVTYIQRALPPLEDKTVVDLACGHGIEVALYEQLGAASVYGIDASTLMVSEAKKRSSQPNHITCATLEATGLPTSFFDVAVCRYALHYLYDLSGAFTETARILKPGGVFVFIVPHPFRDLMNQKVKRYGQQEILAVKLYDGSVTIHYPSHVLDNYFCDQFLAHFTLVDLTEGSQADEYTSDSFALPGYLGITAQKTV